MSFWKVSSNYYGMKLYQIYRLLDVNGVDHSGNREYQPGLFDSEAFAQMVADKLNGKEVNCCGKG